MTSFHGWVMRGSRGDIELRGLGVQDLLELDTQFLPERVKLGQVLVVLALVLNLGLDTCVWMC